MENFETELYYAEDELVIGNFGVFLYDRKTPEDGAVEMNYFEKEEEAIEFGKNKNKKINKKRYWLEVWEKGEEGLWGISGKPLFTSY